MFHVEPNHPIEAFGFTHPAGSTQGWIPPRWVFGRRFADDHEATETGESSRNTQRELWRPKAPGHHRIVRASPGGVSSERFSICRHHLDTV